MMSSDDRRPQDHPGAPSWANQDLAALRRHYTDAGRNKAMKIEDRWHQLRLGLARRRGQQVTVLSLAGYGSPAGSESSHG
ncbi:hypothetical protein [Nesterenkonia pannonica]|uniref:hypothetical protein n=1 Tax=Nesterenkonia pannonica TaxID=1548602 RepID=UPI0021644A91|nr:hypothetical protein [Nesterenkonia pannonica]